MGYTILLQWTFTPPSRHPLTDVILTRVLEHYQLQYSYRTNLQFRTFRAQSKLLTVVQYIPQSRVESSSTSREDVAYLVLDDRSLKPGESSKTVASGNTGMTNGDTTAKGKEKDRSEEGESSASQVPEGGVTAVDEDDDIKIIDPPSTRPTQTAPETTEPAITTRSGKRKREKERQQYQTLAVRPAGAVVPMLHNLLNPFVMGVTKSARQAASTTAQQAVPTSLPGTQIMIQSYNFPPLSTPNPAITLIVHSVPPNSNTIILEAELSGPGDENRNVVEAILKEFLEGCIPDNAGGERKWGIWPDPVESARMGDWEGIERIRRSTQMLTTFMRESSIV